MWDDLGSSFKIIFENLFNLIGNILLRFFFLEDIEYLLCDFMIIHVSFFEINRSFSRFESLTNFSHILQFLSILSTEHSLIIGLIYYVVCVFCVKDLLIVLLIAINESPIRSRKLMLLICFLLLYLYVWLWIWILAGIFLILF